MQSSQEEFKVGDKAVYPAQGVAEVISIDEKDIAGQRQVFLTQYRLATSAEDLRELQSVLDSIET